MKKKGVLLLGQSHGRETERLGHGGAKQARYPATPDKDHILTAGAAVLASCIFSLAS